MNTLLNFIQQNNNWEQILATEPYNLFIKKDRDYVSFNYNQILSDLSLDLVRQARGLIINMKTQKIVCYPFIKFFNIIPHKFFSERSFIRYIKYIKLQNKILFRLIYISCRYIRNFNVISEVRP